MLRRYTRIMLDYLDAFLRLAIIVVASSVILGAALLHNALNYPFAYFKK